MKICRLLSLSNHMRNPVKWDSCVRTQLGGSLQSETRSYAPRCGYQRSESLHAHRSKSTDVHGGRVQRSHTVGTAQVGPDSADSVGKKIRDLQSTGGIR